MLKKILHTKDNRGNLSVNAAIKNGRGPSHEFADRQNFSVKSIGYSKVIF